MLAAPPAPRDTAPEPASETASDRRKPAPAKATPAPEPARKSRGGLVALLLVLVLAGAGAGGYFMGLFDSLTGPQYPVADPFSLVVEKTPDAAPRAVGYAPSEQVQGELARLIEKQQGVAELTLATGNIAETWGPDVLAAVTLLSQLEEWRMAVNGNEARITGATTDRDIAESVEAAFTNGPPGALSGEAQIRFTQLFVSPDALRPVLAEAKDCGPLELVDVPAAGYGPQTPIKVTGRVADTATRIQLFDALRMAAKGRKIDLNVEVLNPTLCLLEQHLPKAPESDIDIAFTVGDRNEPNPSGRFFVGENPVIDVVLPPDVQDGYLTVSVIDVSGNVFHLLPNNYRPENAVAALRDDQPGTVSVRVAYPEAEAARNKIAFRVDDSTLGKSKVVVLHSAAPLFDGFRPTTESAVGYAEALQERFEADSDNILSLDTRILETARP